MGAAPVRPETARSSALASSRPASSSPSGTSAATVAGTPRPSTANMRMKAALAVTMRPSASAVAMPNGADWNTRVNRSSRMGASSRAGQLLAAVEHEHGDDALGAMAAADELGGKGAAVLAQEIELEPGGAAGLGAADGADQRGAIGWARYRAASSAPEPDFGSQPQPLRQRGVEMGQAPLRGHGEQALRQAVVEGERRLQPAHGLDLAGALARDVGHLPERQAPLGRIADGRQKGAHGNAQPAARRVRRPGASGRRTPPRAPRRARLRG